MNNTSKPKKRYYVCGSSPKIGDFVRRNTPSGHYYGIVVGFGTAHTTLPKILWAFAPHREPAIQLTNWLTLLSRANGEKK